jgi:hypothetical protein
MRRMAVFLANPGSRLVHTSDCDYAQSCAELETYYDLAHAYHDGYAEAGCCLGDMPIRVFEVSASVKRAVRAAAGCCVICGRAGRVEMAHVIPRRLGGARRVPLCPNHHQAFDFGELAPGELKKLANHCADTFGMAAQQVRDLHGVGRGARQ